MSRWGPYVEQRIDDLKYGRGREHWDGDWPSPVTVLAAWDWACQAFPEDAPTPSVVPDEDGSIMFVWHKGGWDIEVTVDRESYADLWMHNRKGDGSHSSMPLEEGREQLWTLLSELGRL